MKRYICSLFLILSISLSKVSAIELNTPIRIANLIEQMPCHVPDNGDFHCPQLSETLIFYSESYQGTVNQIGVHLFHDTVMDDDYTLIYKRIERLWLELLLRNGLDSKKALLKEYGVRMVYDGYPLGAGAFHDMNTALNLLRSSVSVSLTTGGTEIDLLCRDISDNTLHIYLPAERDFISPYDKKEAEELLWHQLSKANNKYEMPLTDNRMDDIGHNLYVSGGECYMIDSLRNDVFYKKQGQAFTPVFEPSHPVESMRNMLMGVLPPDILSGKSTVLNFRAYNRNLTSLEMSLDTLLMFFREQDLRPYSALYDKSGNTVNCLLVLHHPILNYIHMINVEADMDTLFSNEKVSMQADITMFIPQHNIKALFNGIYK